MRLTENFWLSEFESKDGSDTPDNVLNNLIELAENLQIIRDHFNMPVTINSGYRSPSHNKAVGGAKYSQHLKGKAADIVIEGHSPSVVKDTIENLIDAGVLKQGGLAEYNTFVHYDVRGHKARW